MKNYILILFAAIFIAPYSWAQNSHPSLHQQIQTLLKDTPGAFKFISQLLVNKIQPRSIELSRLISTSHYDYNDSIFLPIDSNALTYTGINGGDLNSTYIMFSTQNAFVYRDGEYIEDTSERQTFDANDNIDSLIEQIYEAGKWQNYVEVYNAYDANNNDTLEIQYYWSGSSWAPYGESELYYSGNNIDSEIIKSYNSSTKTYVPEELLTIEYTNPDTIAAIQEWDGIGWENYERIIEYSNDTSELVQEGVDTGWVNYERETTSHINNSIQRTYIYEWGQNSWDSSEEVISYFDNTQNDTSDLVLEFDQGEWEDYNKYTYQYNGYNQLTYEGYYTYTYPNFIPSDEDFYHYQTYTTGIEQIKTNSGQISLYPNPSSGEITIISSNNIDDLKVTNLLGQVVYESQPEQQQFNLELYQSGLYFVMVTSNNESTIIKAVVNK